MSGIDWGRGLTNIDPQTGIRFGVIHQNKLLQAWCDSAEPVYNCEDCEEDCFCDPLYFEFKGEGIEARSDEYGDIIITKSPYFTRASFCSPCVPGAGDLHAPDEDGITTYCFPEDWFEEGKAPYPVYKVK